MYCTIGVGVIALLGVGLSEVTNTTESGSCSASNSHLPAPTERDFHYTFENDGILEETGNMEESKSSYFWLNSGARLNIRAGVGETLMGRLGEGDGWRQLYAMSDPLDTQDGFYPQNLFRLITKSTWDNVEQSVRFKLVHLNETDTQNRDEWSGILLMSHYQDGDNLYYAGLRADGNAIIKKKCGGVYTTLATSPVFRNGEPYDRNNNPNLIPLSTWMGLRSVVREQGSRIEIELWLDAEDDGTWEKVLAASDLPSADQTMISGPAYAGIRTDYVDAQFDDYHLKEL